MESNALALNEAISFGRKQSDIQQSDNIAKFGSRTPNFNLAEGKE